MNRSNQNKGNKQLRIKPILLLIYWCILSLILVTCNNERNANQENPDQDGPVAIEAVIVNSGVINPWIYKSGVVRGINEAVVVSETEGIIQSVQFEIGDRLSVGAELLSVDREEARFGMLGARQQLNAAEMNYNASRRLYEDNAISRSEYEQARSSFNNAQASYRAALSRFRNTRITSPIDGTVASKEEGVTRGNYLSPGTPIARIVDLSELQIEVAVGEAEVALVDTGMQALVIVPAVQARVEGRVSAVATGAMPGSGSFPAVVTFDNGSQSIRSGMSARVRIRTTDTDSVLLIPSAALVTDNNAPSVFVVRGQRVERKEVTVIRTFGNLTSISEGVCEGDTVATSRTSTLDHGDPVTVRVTGRSEDLQ